MAVALTQDVKAKLLEMDKHLENQLSPKSEE